MPDLQDWHKRVEMEAKATERSLANLRGAPAVVLGAPEAPAQDLGNGLAVHERGNGVGEQERENGLSGRGRSEQAAPHTAVKAASAMTAARDGAGANRRTRGARKEETREELLSRLLDPTLTLEETARMLEVCPTTVRRYTNRGILPHERSRGNQRRFKLSSVLAFMESQARVMSKADEE